MDKKEIQPLLDAEIDAVIGGATGAEPFWIWDTIPGFPKPPWISPTDPPLPGGDPNFGV